MGTSYRKDPKGKLPQLMNQQKDSSINESKHQTSSTCQSFRSRMPEIYTFHSGGLPHDGWLDSGSRPTVDSVLFCITAEQTLNDGVERVVNRKNHKG